VFGNPCGKPARWARTGAAVRTELFDFHLPAELIAQRPARPRDSARLLVVDQAGLQDRRVLDLPDLLGPADLLVFNDTRVLPTRLVGRRGESVVEVTLHAHEEGGCWRAFAKPGRRCRPGDRLVFAPDFAADVLTKGEGGEVTLQFACGEGSMTGQLEAYGTMPLPPYIKRPRGGDPRDRDDYQTLFARRAGAVAAPTAALHFTEPLMAALRRCGIKHSFVTLHVGAGTFLPVKSKDTEDHVMHAEWYEVPAETTELVARTRAKGGRVIAIGTTVLRTLESAADAAGTLHAGPGQTRLFITPGYRFKLVDALVTNFHLPRSTLFMLTAAFAGLERMHAAYAHAIAGRYRFYSYGDACLLAPANRP
jgi:S-adenosylmethionine:tRNA ribosyltransferase-isomerase